MSYFRKTESGSFEFFVYMGKDAEGNSIKESKTFKRKKDGERWAREKEIEKETGILMEFANMTFEEYIDKWFEEHVEEHLSPVTYDSYYSKFERQILPVLGRFKLKDLQPGHIQTYLTKIRREGGSKNKQKYQYKLLSSALSYANEMNYIHQNPMNNVRKPGKYSQQKIKKKKKKVKAMSRDLLKEWFTFVEDHDPWVADYSFIALNTGMCLEEMLGSRWEDINFNEMTVKVEEARVYKRGEGTITKGPKSDSRFRKIPMAEELADRYRAIWKKQQDIKMDMGKEKYKDNNLILPKGNGESYSPGGVQGKIRKVRRKGGFPEWITSHTFRHTFASLYLSENPNIKELQEILGHHSYTITANTYSHFLPNDFKEAGRNISRAVGSIFGVQE